MGKQKLHKITYNSMKNRGSTLILTNLVGVHPRNIHTKFEASPCSDLRVEVKNQKSSRRWWHRVIARVTLTRWVWLKNHSLVSPIWRYCGLLIVQITGMKLNALNYLQKWLTNEYSSFLYETWDRMTQVELVI